MYSELKKVTWPTRKEMINYTLVVLAFMLVMGVVIGLLDGGAAWLVSAIIGT
ncbi:MAG TPA: preprotein translocase subunit SecE [Candidatus Excrementavichristensenella intestinipullorum]|nr:preprotein translocase subunit SecE [Candidatus Excrementavichristensenella intestinipullorum]